MNKIIITIVGSICVFILTIWFINAYPQKIPSQFEECEEYQKNQYELGFCEGYHWAGSQLQIDNDLRVNLNTKLWKE